MLVLRVLPFGSYALLEKVVVCFETKFGGRGDVVLSEKRQAMSVNGENTAEGEAATKIAGCDRTYVNAPELLNGAECDHFLQQVVPVVALRNQR